MYDVEKIRADFPILGREVNGKPLILVAKNNERMQVFGFSGLLQK